MDRDYIKFVIAYDFGRIFDEMGLACDEAYELVNEVADAYINYTEENNIEQYYNTLYRFCNEISFAEAWEEIRASNN